MTALREQAGTVFIVSHAAQVIEEMCSRAIWLMDGELIGDGPGPEIAHDYRWWSWNTAKEEYTKADQLLADYKRKWAPHQPTVSTPNPTRIPPRHRT